MFGSLGPGIRCTCHGATKSMNPNYWACTPEHATQEKLLQWKSHALLLEKASAQQQRPIEAKNKHKQPNSTHTNQSQIRSRSLWWGISIRNCLCLIKANSSSSFRELWLWWNKTFHRANVICPMISWDICVFCMLLQILLEAKVKEAAAPMPAGQSERETARFQPCLSPLLNLRFDKIWKNESTPTSRFMEIYLTGLWSGVTPCFSHSTLQSILLC